MSESKKPIEQMLVDLEEAKKILEQATDQEIKDLEQALEIKNKAANRVLDARNVFNGIAGRIDEAMSRLKQAAPPYTIWRGDP